MLFFLKYLKFFHILNINQENNYNLTRFKSNIKKGKKKL